MRREPRTPGQTTPDATTPPTAATAPRERILLGRVTRPWIAAGLGVVVGLSLCSAMFLLTRLFAPAPLPAPTALVSSICGDLTNQRYDALYRTLAPTLAAQGTEAQFTASQRQLDSLSGQVTACAVDAQQVSGESANIRLRLTRAQTGTKLAVVDLVAVDARWMIGAYDSALV